MYRDRQKYLEANLRYNQKNREKRRELSRLWRLKNKKKKAEYSKKYYQEVLKKKLKEDKTYILKNKTREETKSLIRKKILIKKPCEVCGEEKVQVHHLNYNDAYDVKWLCRKHHMENHWKPIVELPEGDSSYSGGIPKRFITFNGVTLCHAEWERKLGLKKGCLYDRLVRKTRRKWTIEEALTTK